MEWENAEPVVKSVPWATASIYVNTDGKTRIRVNFSEAMMNVCGHPQSAFVQIGVRDDDCLVRFVWDKEGSFRIKGLGKGGARISAIPAKCPPCPESEQNSEPCDVERKDKFEAIIKLPLKGWEASGRMKARAKVAAVTPPPVTPRPAIVDSRIDGVKYLRSKGLQISRMAGDYYNLNGEKTPKVEVCRRINEFRKAVGLPTIQIDNFD